MNKMAVIELKDVEKIYGKGDAQVEALKDINFEADKSELVLIMGPSGAGKSTFLTIAGSLQKPTSGQVIVNGEDISKFSDKKRNSLRLNEIGFILQAYNLVPYLTVHDQFVLVDKVKKEDNLSKENLDKLLEDLGITKLVKKYPNELSGGQQQRVAIARAVVSNPKLVLADEPTGNLDSRNGKEVMDLLTELNSEGTTIVMVTHSQKDASVAQRTINLFDGQIVSDVRNEL